MLKMKLQSFGHLFWRADSLEKTQMLGKIEGGRRRGWQRMRWLDGITNSMDTSLSKLASWSPWGYKESDTTEQLNSSDKLYLHHRVNVRLKWYSCIKCCQTLLSQSRFSLSFPTHLFITYDCFLALHFTTWCFTEWQMKVMHFCQKKISRKQATWLEDDISFLFQLLCPELCQHSVYKLFSSRG